MWTALKLCSLCFLEDFQWPWCWETPWRCFSVRLLEMTCAGNPHDPKQGATWQEEVASVKILWWEELRAEEGHGVRILTSEEDRKGKTQQPARDALTQRLVDSGKHCLFAHLKKLSQSLKHKSNIIWFFNHPLSSSFQMCSPLLGCPVHDLYGSNELLKYSFKKFMSWP